MIHSTRRNIVATLKHNVTGRLFVVGTTHLKAKSKQENEDRRAAQITAVLQAVSEAGAACESPPLFLLAGDFNCDPFDTVGADGRVNVVSKAVPIMRASASPAFKSAYTLPQAPSDSACKPPTPFFIFGSCLAKRKKKPVVMMLAWEISSVCPSVLCLHGGIHGCCTLLCVSPSWWL